MGAVTNTIINTVQNAPLPLMIEKLGLAIAEAQLELDRNAIQLANAMAQSEVSMPDGRTYNLLAVGFKPTFYAFTEASVEISMEFSLAESESFSIGGGLSFGQGASQNKDGKKESKMFAASLSGYYASKFESSAKGASSIAARIVSLPAPDRYQEILQNIAGDGSPLALKVVAPPNQTVDSQATTAVEVGPQVSGGLAPYTYAWSNSLGTDATADISGLSTGTHTITITVTDDAGAFEEVTFEVVVS